MRQHLKLRPSPRLAFMLAAAHGAVLAVAAYVLPLMAALALAAVLLLSLLYYLLRDAWLRLPESCVELVLDDEGMALLRRDGGQVRGEIRPGALVTPMLTVVQVLPEGGRGARSVAILPDSLDAESSRRLRVWLKWGKEP